MTARRSRLVLSESRNLRMFSFFLFYIGQGLPIGLTVVALPAWMAANGVGDTQVGEMVAWAYLAWTYKFVLAAVMDRFTFLPMGRRRAWLIGAQLVMALGFVWAALLDPGPQDYALLVTVTVIVMSAAAAQDVAVDGLAVDILPEKEQGTASGFMFGGQAFGMAAAGAASGAGLQFLGAQMTFLLFIPALLMITIYAVFLRERPGERILPWTSGEPSDQAANLFVPKYMGRDGQLMITLRSLIRGSSLWYVLAQSLGRTAGGIVTPLVAILATQFVMLSTAEYTSTQGTIDLTVALVGIAIGSWLTIKLGARWATAAVMFAYVLMALFVIMGQPLWTQYPIFVVVLVIWSLLTLLSSICSNPLRMQLSDKRVGATQFTIYNSLANLPVAVGAWMLGRLGGSENLPVTLGTAAALWAAAGVGYALLRMPRTAPVEEDASVEEALGGPIPAPQN